MSATTMQEPIAPPSRLLLLAETRALWEAGAGLALWPLLQMAPRGDGHPVLVLPGLLASDVSTGMLRRYLKARGHDVHGWGQGQNLGPRRGVEDEMLAQLKSLHARSGRKVSLVGWSLGGIYAREVAKLCPQSVRQVITLGTPFRSMGGGNHAGTLFKMLGGDTSRLTPELQAHLRQRPPVPVTSIYSRNDGMVSWRSCLETPGPQVENVQVDASHLGMATHAGVMRVVADRLAQPEGAWRPYGE